MKELSINHKGTWCWVNSNVFCQEGWCEECAIYYDFLERLDWKDEKTRNGNDNQL